MLYAYLQYQAIGPHRSRGNSATESYSPILHILSLNTGKVHFSKFFNCTSHDYRGEIVGDNISQFGCACFNSMLITLRIDKNTISQVGIKYLTNGS